MIIKTAFIQFLLALAFLNAQKIKPDWHSTEADSQQVVQTGLENFLQNYLHIVEGKRVGLVTNQSAVDRNFNLTTDLLFANKRVKLTTLFAVEHGIRGDISAGEKLNDQIDPVTKLKVFSLYGATKRLTVEMLSGIDVIIFDIQDVGVRSYTYISSLGMLIEEAAKNNIKVIVLDRPNPIGGIETEGNILNKDFRSFVGYYPISYRHGMTIAEIALMHNSENNLGADLVVIPLKNWKRRMLWSQTGLPWVPTSPHVPHWKTALYLPLTGIIGELSTINIGVGYTSPFELVAAPWIDAVELADSLDALQLPGLRFRATHFKPYYATYKGESCHGVQIYITDPKLAKPFIAGLHIIKTLMNLYPDHNIFENEKRISSFNRVLGGSWIYNDLMAGKSIKEIEASWQNNLEAFRNIRQKYLLYGTQ
jgi:uncharacterized protein YbbC (DUF1343 family)